MTNAADRLAVCLTLSLVFAPAVALAQGRAGQIWTTTGGDAARTASVRNDARISKDSMSAPGFQLLWKRPLDGSRGAVHLTQPVFSAPGFITYKGFKGVAYLGSSSGTVYAIDYDLNRMFWTRTLSDGAAARGNPCSGDRMAITETTALPQGVGGGRGAAGGRGGAAGGRVGGGGRGAVAALYTVTSAGLLHSLNLQDGSDWFPPAKLLPAANAKMAGAILANSVMYVATAGNCGGVPNGVYAMDLTPVAEPAPVRGALPTVPVATPASTDVARWETHGGDVVGSGPALGPDGTVYVATGDGAYSENAFSDALVALEPKTLTPKGRITPGKTPFTSSPIVFSIGERDFAAAANADGRIYGADTANFLGTMARSPALESGAAASLSTFEDASGARWILAASPRAIAAIKVLSVNGAIEFQPQWSSPVPAASQPAYVNGVVFAIGSNNRLVALDSATGRELWNSGNSITAAARDVGPAVDDGQVYVVTMDGTLYTFGFVVER